MGDGDYYNKQFHVNGEVASNMFLNKYQHYKIKQMSSEEDYNKEHEIVPEG